MGIRERALETYQAYRNRKATDGSDPTHGIKIYKSADPTFHDTGALTKTPKRVGRIDKTNPLVGRPVKATHTNPDYLKRIKEFKTEIDTNPQLLEDVFDTYTRRKEEQKDEEAFMRFGDYFLSGVAGGALLAGLPTLIEQHISELPLYITQYAHQLDSTDPLTRAGLGALLGIGLLYAKRHGVRETLSKAAEKVESAYNRIGGMEKI